METQRQAQWIWFPGEYEFLLGLKVWNIRCERGTHITPEWKVESLYPNIWFRKTVTVSHDTVVYPKANGQLAVRIDHEPWYRENPTQGVTLTAGTHFFQATVYHPNGLPCFYLNHPEIKTDETWEASWVKSVWKQADCRDFTDPLSPPADLKFVETPVPPVSVQAENGGLLLDFGKEMAGVLRFFEVAAPGTVSVAYGESREEALDWQNCELYETYSVADGFTTPAVRAFRYLFFPHAEENAFRLEAVSQLLPLQNKGSFSCADQEVNRIYEVAAYTLLLNSREFYLDGIKRDHWVWSGDATQSYLLNFYTFFDLDICRRTIRLLRGKDPVATHLNTIQDYSCYWLISLYDYYLYTGDADFLAKIYDEAQGLLAYCCETMDDRGFMNPRPEDWVFVDWAPIDNRGDVAAIQLLFARALEAMAQVAGATGHSQDAKRYQDMFRKTLDSCFCRFWSPEAGCFTHGPADAPDKTVTRYPNLFALLFGYLTPQQREQVIANALLNDQVLPITTPYMKFYELMALCEAGKAPQVWQYLKDYWGGMLKEGATSFWEAYDPAQTGAEHYAMYGKPYGKSLCHAWAAGPVLLLGKYFLGVRPTAPGYASFEISPCPPGQNIQGTVPAPNGEIQVCCGPDSVTVTNRTSGMGTLRWNGASVPVPPGETVSL